MSEQIDAIREEDRLVIAAAISDIEANRPVRVGMRFRVMAVLSDLLDEPTVDDAPCPGCICSTFTGPHKLSDRHPRERSCRHEEE